MAILCAAIMSKTKPLVARQFVPLTRRRVEALLSEFLTLLETQPGRNLIVCDSAQYLYTPLECIYLVLVTDRCSNIISESATLMTFQQIVVDLVPGIVTLEAIASNTYRLLYAMDELVACDGERELVSIAQVKEYILMESAEEKLQNIIRRSKEAEEDARRRKRAQELDREKLRRLEQERIMQRTAAAAASSMLSAVTMVESPATEHGGSSNVVTQPPAETVTSNGMVHQPLARRGLALGGSKKGIRV